MEKAPPIFDRTMHEARKYWRARSHEMAFFEQVALDHPRPPDGNQDLATLERELDPDVDALLQRVTGGKPLLLYTALVLGLRICCSKYTGRPDVTLLSGSRSAEGGTVNLLPIGGALAREAAFKDALLATREQLAGAFKHQQYPLERLLLDLDGEARPEHLSLVVSMAGFSDEPADQPCDIAVRFDPAERTTARVRFDRRLYEEATIAHFLAALNAVLRHGLSDMATPVAELSPDGPEAAEAAEPAPAPAVGSLHELIEARAGEQGNRAAVVEGERVTSYSALVADADRVAEALAGLDLDRQRPVGILMDAGAEMVLSMLAVLKAGAAFALIKSLALEDGLTATLAALDCEVILCREELLAELRKIEGSLANVAHAVTVDYPAAGNGEPADSLRVTATAHRDPGDRAEAAAQSVVAADTAAVFVHHHEDGLAQSAVSHATLAGLFGWLNERAGIGPEDRCLLSPALGAGQQLYDTLGMLTAGASVEIPSAADLETGSRLLDRLLAGSTTVWDVSTELAQNLLAEIRDRQAARADLAGPRTILLSGEKQSVSLADKLRDRFPDAQVLGLYSSPAVGIWSTYFPLEPDGNGIPVAHAVPGFTHQVVNALRETAPRYAEGRLLLDGAAANGEAVDTGLRAVRLEGRGLGWLRGEDRYLVKYGCRVELTKVEAELCRHEHIDAADVILVAEEGRGARSQVVAFVIADRDHLTAEDVRDLLVQSDAVDLVPDLVVLVDEFPLAMDGAIDRVALIAGFRASGAPAAGRRSVEDEEIERALKVIWLEALQVDEVGDDDSFFAMGGNSLKATLLIARIKDGLGVDLSVQDFFREPSIRGVAQVIAAKRDQAGDQPETVGVRAVARDKYRVRTPQPESHD